MPQHVKRHSAVPEERHKHLKDSVLTSMTKANEITRDWPK